MTLKTRFNRAGGPALLLLKFYSSTTKGGTPSFRVFCGKGGIFNTPSCLVFIIRDSRPFQETQGAGHP